MAKTRKRGKGPSGHGSSAAIAAEVTEAHRRKRGLTPLSDRERVPPDEDVPAKPVKPGYVNRQRAPRHQSRR